MSVNAAPLAGIKVVEFAGLAPAPFCGLILADWGATITRIDRADQSTSLDVLARGKRSLGVNLKSPEGIDIVKKLVSKADVLIDPFRPGRLEKLGLGPDVFLGDGGLNKRLVYTRIVGFPPNGHQKNMAGHDLNYLATSGVLSMMPHSNAEGRPSFPLNILGDFAGGGQTAANGILLALFERSKSGLGQIVETDMVGGARYLSSFPIIHQALHTPLFSRETGSNPLDGGAPYYDVYRCKDGGWFTVAAFEPQFYAIFLETFLPALPPASTPGDSSSWIPTVQKQSDRKEWAKLRAFLEAGFLSRTRDEWTKVFDGLDACAVAVLSPSEAAEHSTTSSLIPQPHPQLSRTPAAASVPATPAAQALGNSFNISPGAHTDEILAEMGVTEEQKKILVQKEVIRVWGSAAL
ncbi:CoA-transferase family III [Hysterangium stoloniferum]|nr:CoA-transferase family III [Hysterangium stoloniferum]